MTRSSALARVGSDAAARARVSEFLSFHLGREEYGIDILKVQEIRGYESPTRIANAPAYVLGVLNLRGTIVPIYDLRVRFGLEAAEFNGQTVTIVLNLAGRVAGIVVDAVSDVIDLAPANIHPAPEFSSGLAHEHIVGLGSIQDGERRRLLILTDIERLVGSFYESETALLQ